MAKIRPRGRWVHSENAIHCATQPPFNEIFGSTFRTRVIVIFREVNNVDQENTLGCEAIWSEAPMKPATLLRLLGSNPSLSHSVKGTGGEILTQPCDDYQSF